MEKEYFVVANIHESKIGGFMSERLEPIIGVEIVDDIRLGHIFHEVDVIESLVKQELPLNFVEIGVHEGGLSYLLIPKFTNICYYTGIEIYCSLIQPKVVQMYKDNIGHVTLMCLDCFNPTVFEYISELKNKIVYCDGGNKAKEIAHFKSALHHGDIIMCHDFYDGTRKVRAVPVDNISIEVKTSDIQIYENDTAFERLPEDMFKETRIIGWKKL